MVTVNIPGWDAHPDRVPASPSSFDEEFDGTLTGWTAINPGGNLTYDANATIPSHLYMSLAATVGEDTFGVYKAAPTPPFTVTAKVCGFLDFSNNGYCYQAWGIGVGEASPGRYVGIWAPNNEYTDTTTTVEFNEWTDPTTFSRSLTLAPNAEGYAMHGEWYLRLVVTSATSIASYYSPNGLLWLPRYPAYAPSPAFSGGGLSVILAQIQNPPTPKGAKGAFDWVRFT